MPECATIYKKASTPGATQDAGSQLAARVRRPHSVIGMIESEQRQVTVPEFITLAEEIGVDPLELFRAVLRRRKAP